MKYVAKIQSQGEEIKIGIKGNKKEGYEVILSNGNKCPEGVQKTYEDAIEVVSGWDAPTWGFEWLEA